MIRKKYAVPVCIGIVALTLLIGVAFTFGEALGIDVIQTEPPYVQSLFSTDRVHTLDIVVDEADWQELLDSAASKEYIPVNVVIDGNAVKNVALRTKGNSSLSSIVSSDSDRYSFKIEFDHYQTGQSYFGLDKLALNNIAQDNTYLKDYLSYQMMNAFQADSPLSSFIWITVNGADWGLYLAVEGIEEAFAARSYGSGYGQIYKPDSMDMMGGNRGGEGENARSGEGWGRPPDGFPSEMPERFSNREASEDGGEQEGAQAGEGWGRPPDGFTGELPEWPSDGEAAEGGEGPGGRFGPGGGGMGGFGGRGTDVALVYTDDEQDSYPNIFDNAIFDPTDADRDRLIASLKQLSTGENLEAAVNIEEVLRYFVVHNFVLNFDSYTGSMMHNYYLYEEDGVLSMIAWDYNLGFGAFAGMGGGMSGSGSDSATALVNYPIDTPVSGTTLEDRPLLGQLLANEAYLERYHQLFAEFLTTCFDSGWFEQQLDSALGLISPYVERDPTAFCSYEEFTEAAAALKEFCLLRAQSVEGQLEGSIPATDEGQAEDSSVFVDASHIDMSSMGSNASSFGGRGGRPDTAASASGQAAPSPAIESAAAEATDETPPAIESAAEATDEAPPAETENAFPPAGGMGGQGGDFSPPGQGGQGMLPGAGAGAQSSSSALEYAFLGGCVFLLALGILAAKRYRVHR